MGDMNRIYPNREIFMPLPLSISCDACRNPMLTGYKRNARREVVMGERVGGIQICKYSFNCSRCSAEFTLNMDPQAKSYYTVDSGATLIDKDGWDELVAEEELIGGPRRTDEN